MKLLFIKVTLASFILLTASIASAENIVLINPFTVPAGQLEASVEFWEKSRAFLQKEPGYVSTRLHRSIQPDATYQLINVAEWDSVESFVSASKKMKDYFRSEKITMVAGLKYDPALYHVIRR